MAAPCQRKCNSDQANVVIKSVEGSWKFPLVFVEHAPYFFDLFLRAATAGEHVLHQLARGAAEHALQHVGRELLLGLLRRLRRL